MYEFEVRTSTSVKPDILGFDEPMDQESAGPSEPIEPVHEPGKAAK